jgi:hypothetical protein
MRCHSARLYTRAYVFRLFGLDDFCAIVALVCFDSSLQYFSLPFYSFHCPATEKATTLCRAIFISLFEGSKEHRGMVSPLPHL